MEVKYSKAALKFLAKSDKATVNRIRIGMLTSGGDCQALNAAMRGVNMNEYQKKAWDCLTPTEQQSLFLQLSESKSCG